MLKIGKNNLQYILIDFTPQKYIELIKNFINLFYKINTVECFVIKETVAKLIILRHDVDRFPNRTLNMARLESEIGISSTYYFRIIKSVFKEDILKEVADLGHEIGYHYEDLAFCKGNYEKAIDSFKKNLEQFRNYYPVKTICMHGSPLSKWDNKKLWEKYDYKKYGIIADTSLDIDYDEVFYITDNGFGWNKTSTSVRDKVKSKFNIPIKNTGHLILLIRENKLPNKIMLNAHPDTFFDPGIKWLLNYSYIKTKNIAKWFVVKTGMIK